MNKKREENKKKRLAEELSEQYGEILQELSRLPAGTKENREARWNWFRTHPQYEPLFMKTLEAYSLSGYNFMIRCEGSGDLTKMRKGKSSEIGSEEFLLAVKETVESYTEEKVREKAEEGKEGAFFIACVGTKYKQKLEKSRGAEEYNQGGVMPDIPENRKCRVMKYVHKLEEGIEKRIIEEDPGFWEERLRELNELKSERLTKKEWDAIRRRVTGMNITLSTNDVIGDEEDGATLEDFIRDQAEQAEEKIEREEREAYLGIFLKNIAENWAYVKCATNKRMREWIRIFLTKDILIELKLDSLPERTKQERKQWGDSKLEPYCGQWCPRRKRCSLPQRPGCYVRYQNKPAGTENVYKILSPHASIIFQNLLVKAYVDRAIEGETKNLYEVYENYLREDFDFRDRVLGEVIHKDKSAVSKVRSQYEGKIREELYRQFLEKRGDTE